MKNYFSKFCGCILCDSCSNLKRKLPKADFICTICQICENKFLNFQLHQEFTEKLSRKELEISETNQKLEKFTILYSEQLDEIRKLNELKAKKKKENELKEEMLITETNNLIIRKQEICDLNENMNIKINESIGNLKFLDEKKNNKEIELKKIQKDREDITYEYESRQNYLQEILSKINSLSMSLKNQNQKTEKNTNRNMISSKIQNISTGNKKLDILIKEKQKLQVFVCF